ncbi:hypothetical protein L916_11904, partial [Phytophthora nicotianae]
MTGQLKTYIHKLFADYDMSPKSTKISNDDFAKWNIPSDRKNTKSFVRDQQRCNKLVTGSAREAWKEHDLPADGQLARGQLQHEKNETE